MCDRVEASHQGQVVAMELEIGAYAVDETTLVVAKRLPAQRPEAKIG